MRKLKTLTEMSAEHELNEKITGPTLWLALNSVADAEMYSLGDSPDAAVTNLKKFMKGKVDAEDVNMFICEIKVGEVITLEKFRKTK